jgi:hypothetical protein
MNVIAIVEGDGEVQSLPILLRRLGEWRTPGQYVSVPTPIRIRRDRFLNRDEEFSRYLLLAAGKCEEDGWILVLLDADDDCPADLGVRVLRRATECVPHRRVSVVLANREYEAWFIAAARSLDGFRGFAHREDEHVDPEVPRDAKGWVRQHLVGRSYGETTDQPAFSARMDLEEVFRTSRSFRKLCAEWDRQLS